MTRVRNASLAGGIVSVEGFPVDVAEVFSEGAAPSDGVAILDKDKVFYFAKTSPDLKTTLEKVIDALGQVKTALDKTASALSTLDEAGYIIAVGGGSGAPAVGTPATPFATSDISEISSAATQIDTLKTALNTLKGALK